MTRYFTNPFFPWMACALEPGFCGFLCLCAVSRARACASTALPWRKRASLQYITLFLSENGPPVQPSLSASDTVVAVQANAAPYRRAPSHRHLPLPSTAPHSHATLSTQK